MAMARKKLVDVKSYELAEHFMEDYASRVGPLWHSHTYNLAEHIQQTIEDWLSDLDKSLNVEPFPKSSHLGG